MVRLTRIEGMNRRIKVNSEFASQVNGEIFGVRIVDIRFWLRLRQKNLSDIHVLNTLKFHIPKPSNPGFRISYPKTHTLQKKLPSKRQ